MPDLVGKLGQGHARGFSEPVRCEQAQLDPRRVCGVESEIYSATIVRRAQGHG
jgi:hypothetical protein